MTALARSLLAPGRRHAWPVLLLFLAGFAAPLLTVLLFSFAEPKSFSIWHPPTLENYRTIFGETYYISFLWSLAFAAISCLILALICYPVAFGLVRLFGRWSTLVTLAFTIPLFVSENLRLYGWVLFFGKGGVLLGGTKSLFGIELESVLFTPEMVVFGMVYVYLPFTLFPMTLGLSMVPPQLVEAAGDLGASRWQVFREVELPLAMPRRWTAVRHAREHGVDIHRNVTVTRITESGVEWTDAKGDTASAPADMVIYADGTTAAAPLADDLRAAGIDCEVIGDAGEVGYIHGAVHSAWRVASKG